MARRLRYGLAAVLSVLVLFGAVGGWAAYAYFDRRIERVAIGDLGDDRPPARGDATNVLLVGTDSRLGTGKAFGDVAGQRSDTTILAHISADDQVTMVSFPRDMYVLVPEYTGTDGKVHPPTENKFNSALSEGGPTLLIKLVERMTRLRIDHYVSVDLAGFMKISEVVGGVDVCIKQWDGSATNYNEELGRNIVSTNTNDPYSQFRGGPGTIQIQGEQALAFVRQRYGLPDSDIDRTRRQQYFLSRILAKVGSGGVLNNPSRVTGLLGAVGDALELDSKTKPVDLGRLAGRLQGAASGGLQTQTIPTHAATREEGAIDPSRGEISNRVGSVEMYNQADLDAVFEPLGGGGGSVDADSGAQGEAGARITVVNGTTVAGVASRVVRDLAARGVSADTADSAPRSDYKATWIRYGADAEATARRLLPLMPGARLASDGSVEGVQIIVGSAFDGVVDPPDPNPAVQALAAGENGPASGPGATPSTRSAPVAAATGAAGTATGPGGSAEPLQAAAPLAPAPPEDCVY